MKRSVLVVFMLVALLISLPAAGEKEAAAAAESLQTTRSLNATGFPIVTEPSRSRCLAHGTRTKRSGRT